MNVGVFTYTFSEDISLLQINSCPAWNCTNNVTCGCDYRHSQCGYSTCQTNQCNIELCDTNRYNWTDLQLNQRIYGTVEENQLAHFRFFIRKGCKGYRLRTELIYGIPSLFVSHIGPPNPTNNIWFKLGGFTPVSMLLCPSDRQFQEEGTYFVAVQGYESTAFNLWLEEMEVPEIPKELPNTENCVNFVDSTHKCVQDGVPIDSTIEGLGQHFYMYNLTGCQKLFMHLDCRGNGLDCDIYVSGTGEKFPFYGTSDYAAYGTGDDMLSLSVCPPDNTSWIPLWITIDIWVSRK